VISAQRINLARPQRRALIEAGSAALVKFNTLEPQGNRAKKFVTNV